MSEPSHQVDDSRGGPNANENKHFGEHFMIDAYRGLQDRLLDRDLVLKERLINAFGFAGMAF